MYAPGIDRRRSQRHGLRNLLQSILLVSFMGLFLALLGGIVWGGDGLLFLVGVGVVALLFNPGTSTQLVMRMYQARRLDHQHAAGLIQVLHVLAERAGLPSVPKLYYLPSSVLNAFATGSRHDSAIAVSDGLLKTLNLREMTAVLAHEVSHIRSRDLWVMGLADTISRATSVLSLIGQFLLILALPFLLFSDDIQIHWSAILLLVFAPTLSALAQLALSRTREFDADLGAAELTNDPGALISALRKIEQVQNGWLERILLPGRRVPDPSLLRTHPDTSERIERLRNLMPENRWDRIRGVPSEFVFRPSTRTIVMHQPRWHLNGLWY